MDDAPDDREESARTAENVEALKDLAELVRNELDLRIDGMVAAKAKEVFLSSVNHDIKSPLHGLMASTELLASEDDNNYSRFTPFQKQCISNIQHCSNGLMDVINNALSFDTMVTKSPLEKQAAATEAATPRPTTAETLAARNDLPRPSLGHAAMSRHPTDLCQLVEDVLDSCWTGKRHCQNKNAPVRAIVNIAPEIISTTQYLIDKGEFTRAVMNIFSNGCKYTDVGYVQVSVFADPVARFQGLQSVCIVVQDTGRGIPQAFIESGALFQPFQQNDSSCEGVGLGMSIVKRLLEQNDGELTVNSIEGLGTTVTMRFELEPAPEQRETHLVAFPDKRYYLGDKTLAKTDQKICEAIVMALERWYGLSRATVPTDADVAIMRTIGELDTVRAQCPSLPCILISDGASDWKSLDGYADVQIAQIPVGAKKIGKLLEQVFRDRSRQGSTNAVSAAMTALSTDADDDDDDDDANDAAAAAAGMKDAPAEKVLAPTPPLDNTSRETITPCKTATKRSAQGAFSPATALLHDVGGLRRRSSHGLSVTAPTGETVRILSHQGLGEKPASRVLCCEDDEVNLRILATIVEKLGYAYELARDGSEALQRYADALDRGQPFDTVLCDLGLPSIDGLQVAKRIRLQEQESEASHRARIIALTGGHGADDVANCRAAGMDEYLQKPVPVKVLRKILTASVGDNDG